MSDKTKRYAVYFMPLITDDLWSKGCAWLGRDCEENFLVAQPKVPGLDAESIMRITQKPTHYGLHATLKPPFYLQQGCTEVELRNAFVEFASRYQAFECGQLVVGQLQQFLALTLVQVSTKLNQLAAECVQSFDAFRKLPSEQELALRRAAGLNEIQLTLLEKWGYPYVMDQFRFHITLTDTINNQQKTILKPFLDSYFKAALIKPLSIKQITLAVQNDRNSPFVVLQRYDLSGWDRRKNDPKQES